jgi:DNA-binding response OmpR family regulator
MTRPDTKTLLIADDDHDLVSVLSLRCRRMGLTVLTAFDAFTALSLVRSKMPDLVCLDVGMPAGNGLSVCEMMTSDATFRDIPVIVLTGRSDPHTICRCHSMCAYYVEKSTDTWTRLEPLLRELLELPAATQPAEQPSADSNSERKAAPVFPSLSALYADSESGKPKTTTEVPAARLGDPSDSMEAPGDVDRHSREFSASDADSAEIHADEPRSQRERETCSTAVVPEKVASGETPRAERSQISTDDIAVGIESFERETGELVSDIELESAAEIEPASEFESDGQATTEPTAEHSSMWRSLAQAMGRVVKGSPHERDENSEASASAEEPASVDDSAEEYSPHGATSPTCHASVSHSIERPSDNPSAIDSDRLLPLSQTHGSESASREDIRADDSAIEPALSAGLDNFWTLVSDKTRSPGSAGASDRLAAPAPLQSPQKRGNSQPESKNGKTILIADDDGDLVQMLMMRCTQLGLKVFRSPDAMHALLGAHRVQPDLVVLDVNMPGGNGLSVCEMMAGDPTLAQTPVIIMTGDKNEEIPRRCQAMHAQFIEKGAGLWERLEQMIRKSLAMPAPIPAKAEAEVSADSPEAERRPRILCIDDDPDISKILKLRLEPYGVDVLRAFNGMQGYWTALDMRPDLVILDMVMPDGGGNYIMGRLRSHPLTAKVPVLMLTGVNTPGVRRQMFSLGVDGFLTKPLDFDALIDHLSQYMTLRDRAGKPLVRKSEPAADPAQSPRTPAAKPERALVR